MSVTITFLGGASTVTGSKYLVQHDGKRLLVDCGLFQGYKQLRLRNWAPLPVPPDQIHAVLLTHAHLDHSGYIPLLAKEGFSGHVYASRGTRDLCRILWPDSGHIQEEDAAFANRHGFSKHAPALPLYTRQDALDALPLLKTVEFDKTINLMPGWKASFSSAGHILGASSILLEVAGRRILFSGDLGRPDDLIMSPPDDAPQADTVLIESTYGDRIHPKEDIPAELAPALQRVAKRGGVAVVPVFAVGRAQAVLHAIHLLKVQGDSMIDAMINDGDIVVLKPASEARNGEMVAIWLPEKSEATLKYFFKEKDGYTLKPANPTMPPIRVPKSRQLEIKGKVVMVIRKMDAIKL